MAPGGHWSGEPFLEPEVQKFAAVALVGLLAFFPVFNQVKDTALEALTDADHQAKWKSFFKNWDDIPEDEKLEYWDGRNKPPGADGGFDRDRVDDDARFRDSQNPPPQPKPGDRDGDGIPDDEDSDPDDPDNSTRREYEVVQVLLWDYPRGDAAPSGQQEAPGEQPIETGGRSFDDVRVEWDYSGFTGTFNFELLVSGSVAWQEDDGAPSGSLAVRAEDGGDETIPQVGTQPLSVDYEYSPVGGAPDEFRVVIYGYYKEYSDGEAA